MTEPSNSSRTASHLLAMPVRDFIASVAAKAPVPGGGSVAGVVGALSVALGEMAMNFTRGKKRFAEHAAAHKALARRLLTAREMFQQLTHDDAEAFSLYSDAGHLPDQTARHDAQQVALAAAIDVPREMTKLALAVLEDLYEFADSCNPWLYGDLCAAAFLAVAAAKLSDYNVQVNTAQMEEDETARELRAASTADVRQATMLSEAIELAVSRRLRRS